MQTLNFQQIRSILRTSTVRQSIITSAAIFLSSGLGAVYYLVLAKALGPRSYGLFSLAIAALSIVMSVADLGIGQGLVKFVGGHRSDNQYFPFVKFAWQIKMAMGLAVTLIFWLGSAQIAKIIFHQPELTQLLPIVGLAVFSQLLFYLVTSIFQGLQKFSQWGGLQVGANIIRLVLLLPLIYFAKLSSLSAILVYTISYLSSFLVSTLWLDLGWLKSKITPEVKKEFWDFNRWTALFVILASITGKLDTVLTGRYLSLSDVGVYSLAATMVSFLPQLATAVGAVTTAKFAGIADREHEKSYLKKSLLFVSSISTGVAILMIPTALVVITITGRDYSQAILPFLILLLGNLLFLVTNPIRDSILYFHSKPKFFVVSSVIQGLSLLVSGLILIPMYGVVGVAIAMGVSQLVAGTLSVGYYLSIRS